MPLIKYDFANSNYRDAQHAQQYRSMKRVIVVMSRRIHILSNIAENTRHLYKQVYAEYQQQQTKNISPSNTHNKAPFI